METKLTEEQKQKLCELIEESLNRVRLQNYKTDDDDNLPLVDLLSTGETILEGLEEIENIIEQIYFDMDAWDISLKPVEIPEITDNTFSGQSAPDLCCGVYEEPPLELRICTRCGKEFKSNVDCPICPSCYL